LHESADIQNNAGVLPYVTLIVGVAVVAFGYSLAG